MSETRSFARILYLLDRLVTSVRSNTRDQAVNIFTASGAHEPLNATLGRS